MSLKRKAADLAAEDAKKPKQNSSITSFFKAPKDASEKSNGTTSASPKFDKAAWVAKLTSEQKELLQLEIDTLDESWLYHLKEELVSPSFLDLKRFLKKEYEGGKKIFPPKEDIYSWSRHTPFDKIKVVILGQDPYHNHNQAHGLCFSVRPPTPAPPSLKNIYQAIKKDYPSFTPPPKNGGLLTPWADRGVLLLNTCLTVRAHEAFSHSNKGWERLTGKAIEAVNRVRPGVVFLAWGSPAQKKCTNINSRHLVLKSVHPSPLSAHKSLNGTNFFDSAHFKKTNAWLKTRYGEEGVIDWNLNVDPAKAGV